MEELTQLTNNMLPSLIAGLFVSGLWLLNRGYRVATGRGKIGEVAQAVIKHIKTMDGWSYDAADPPDMTKGNLNIGFIPSSIYVRYDGTRISNDFTWREWAAVKRASNVLRKKLVARNNKAMAIKINGLVA